MPVSEKPLIGTKGQIRNQLLENIAQQFQLSSSWNVLPIVPINGDLIVLNNNHTTTLKAVVKDDSGVYLIKQVPWYCSSEPFVSGMTDFIKHLHSQSFPTPALSRTEEGKLYALAHGKLFYCQEFLFANSYGGSREHVRSMGSNLAHLHNISTRFSQEGRKFEGLPIESSSSLAQKMTDLLVDQIEEARVSDGRKKSSAAVHRYQEFVQRRLSLWSDHLTGGMPMVIHGDYNPYNLLFGEDDSVIATLDYENVAVSCASHDLAEGLMGVAVNKYRDNSTRFSEIGEHIDEEKVRLFLQGYTQSREGGTDINYSGLAYQMGAIMIQLASLGFVRKDYKIEGIIRVSETIDRMVDVLGEKFESNYFGL